MRPSVTILLWLYGQKMAISRRKGYPDQVKSRYCQWENFFVSQKHLPDPP